MTKSATHRGSHRARPPTRHQPALQPSLTFDVQWLHHVVVDQLKVLVADPMLHVPLPAGEEVVHHSHFMTIHHEFVCEVGTHKACAPGYLRGDRRGEDGDHSVQGMCTSVAPTEQGRLCVGRGVCAGRGVCESKGLYVWAGEGVCRQAVEVRVL